MSGDDEQSDRVVRHFGGPVDCKRCGALSWYAAANPVQPCLPCLDAARKEAAR